jgi:SAM-dependent methyltransferase
MEQIRKPFQGVRNIVRFNWHFYVLYIGACATALLFGHTLPANYQLAIDATCLLATLSTVVSLIVSYYVYDVSGFYGLNWIEVTAEMKQASIMNIHAGFDETSYLLQRKFPGSNLTVFDFYDPLKHTEVSIKRARKAYPAFPGTKQITTAHFPLEGGSADFIFVILSAHEIRDDAERIIFFKELGRVMKPGGSIFVTEHLRDFPNFLAYNIGFLHFLSKPVWKQTFAASGLDIIKETKSTPFITTFILRKHVAAS